MTTGTLGGDVIIIAITVLIVYELLVWREHETY